MNINKILKLQSYSISDFSLNSNVSNASWFICSSLTFFC